MVNGHNLVRPGDLIRADDFNSILNRLSELMDRVERIEEQLGGGTAPRIVRITPDQPRVGDEMRIVGGNFDFSVGTHGVSFDGVSVSTFKPGSADNLLIFDVPTVLVPEGGRSVVLRVINRLTSTTRTIFLLPALGPIGGDVVDLLADGPVGGLTPVAGQPFTLAFRLNSRSSRSVLFTLSATVPELAVAPEFLDEDGPMASPTVTVPAGGVVSFSVRIAVPAGTDGTPFTVLVRADGQTTRPDSGRLPFTVGTAAEQADEAIDPPAPTSVSAPAQLTGTTILLPRGRDTELSVTTGIRRAGDFEFALSGVGGGWQISTELGATGGTITVTQAQIDANPGPEPTELVPISIFLTAPVVAAAPLALTLSVRQRGGDRTTRGFLQLVTT